MYTSCRVDSCMSVISDIYLVYPPVLFRVSLLSIPGSGGAGEKVGVNPLFVGMLLVRKRVFIRSFFLLV